MGLKTYNPTSPGRRQLITTDRSELWNGAPVKDSEMKAMKGTLTERNVWDIVNFLRTLAPKPGTAKPAVKS